jgi:FkbM family methyltransferase
MAITQQATDWLRRRGVHVGRHPLRHTLEERLLALHRMRDLDLVLDVGAFTGGFGRSLRDVVGYRGDLISFEPSSGTAATLRKAAAGDDRWRVEQVALGARAEQLTLNVADIGLFSSLHPPTTFGTASFSPLNAVRQETVDVRRADELVPQLVPDWRERTILLKVDAQGHDGEVLDGATGLMAAVVGLVVELPVKNMYEGAPQMLPFLERLLATGLELAGLFPVVYEPDSMAVVEMDCLLVRPEPATSEPDVP